MIRQKAFIEKRPMLKGALHCHTTRSDGLGTPYEVIRLHAANGYDFMALTDHRIYNFKNYAPDTQMTVIPGMEFDAKINGIKKGFRCFHTVCLGQTKENGNVYEQDQSFTRAEVSCQQEYQPFLDEFHKNNELTVYCHPEWSSTPARYFDKLKGNFAMEIWNTGCVMDNNMDSDAAYWDEILGQGIKIFGVATDDGHAVDQHCKGWVMVNSENSVTEILKALSEGAFYSSTGPVIKDFYIEGNIAHIECSPVSMIALSGDCHPTQIIKSENDDLTSADFSIVGRKGYDYIRITVYEKGGKRAWTNPIWIE